MGLVNSPNIVTNGLVFYYDMNNYQKSWVGQPTTNLVGDGMSIYNNVPGDVTATLATTGEFYRGAAIYKLTLTPTTASGVSYLTAGNNPGIGVVSGGGGGLANRYTGHSIFFRPTVPMHSTAIYTNYSNIGGWQSSTNYYSMNDGWLRAHVIWYDTVTRSDGKYWAINPAGATLNVPIVIYWAGPFKEDRNDSVFVSPYTTGTRNSTQAIYDLTNNNTITATSLTYASDGTFSFNAASSNYIDSGYDLSWNNTNSASIEFWCKPSNISQTVGIVGKGLDWEWQARQSGDGLQFVYWNTGGGHSNGPIPSVSGVFSTNVWKHITIVWSHTANQLYLYANGILISTSNWTDASINANKSNTVKIGGSIYDWGGGSYWSGSIGSVKFYSNALSATEVLQNFNAQRGLYGV